MKKIVVPIIVCIAPMLACAQIQFKCKVNNAAGKGLPYAAVYCSGNRSAVTASKNGDVTIRVENAADTLLLAYPGCQTKMVVVADMAPGSAIVLEPQAVEASAAQAPDKQYTFPDQGDRKGTALAYEWAAYAVRVHDSELAGKTIAKIVLTTSSEFNKAGDIVPNKTFARLYAVGPDGKPGADLLKENVEIDPYNSDYHTASADISKFGIVMPAEGLYVGVETVPATQFARPQKGDHPWPYLALTEGYEECFTMVKEEMSGTWRPLRELLEENLSKITAPSINTLAALKYHNAVLGVRVAKEKGGKR